MQPAITVLLPVHNAAAFLREAIDSILHQTYRDFELLIIEDGADPATKSILMTYNDPRIRIIHHEVNKGLIWSLNEGIDQAKGKYIARMDADDISYPERLAVQVDWMEQHPDIAVFGSQIEDADGVSSFSPVPTDPENVKASLLFSCCIAHPSVMLRTSVLQQHNFRYDPDYLHGEDYELWSRIAVKHQLANHSSVLLKYRLHGDQVSQKFSERQLQSMYRVQEHLLRRLGVPAGEDAMKLHTSFALLRFENTADYCEKVSVWLMDIENANNRTGIYQRAALRKTLGRWWYSYCAFQVDNKLKLKTAIMKAGATHGLLNTFQQLKLVLRILLR